MQGTARGLDEGLVSGTISQKSFISEYGLTVLEDKSNAAAVAQKTGNIAAMVQIGSVAGALLAFIVSDRIGRIWATRQLTLVWIIGTVVYVTAKGNYGQILAGRFVMGLGIGQTTVVAPTSVVCTLPRILKTDLPTAIWLRLLLARFVDFASVFSRVLCTWALCLATSPIEGLLCILPVPARQWFIPNMMHIIFAGVIFIASFFALESPRYLCRKGDFEGAALVMTKLRNLPSDHVYVQAELIDIKDQLEREREATLGSAWFGPLKELVLIKSNLYRFMLGFAAQVLGQWSGGGFITIYAPQFFTILGTTGQSEKLFATAVFGVVKFASALICAFFLVDFLGRKRALGAGITLQLVSVLYAAIFLTAVPQITKVDTKTGATVPLTGAAHHAATGAIVFIYFSGVAWALGWNSIQDLIGAEIFPLRVRSLANSLIMCIHFVNQYGSSKAVPLMLLPGSLAPSGTFWFFSAVTWLGLVWVWFFLPETAGKSLESMDEKFSLPWYLIGRKGAEMSRGRGAVAEATENGGDLDKISAVQAEHAGAL